MRRGRTRADIAHEPRAVQPVSNPGGHTSGRVERRGRDHTEAVRHRGNYQSTTTEVISGMSRESPAQGQGDGGSEDACENRSGVHPAESGAHPAIASRHFECRPSAIVQRPVPLLHPSCSSSVSTRCRIWSRISRTRAMGLPLGFSSGQSARFRPGTAGH
jgi:hypothetical protein